MQDIDLVAAAPFPHEPFDAKEKDYDHQVRNIFKDSPEYCWCEGAKGTGVGEYIEIWFDDYIYLSNFKIFNGYSKSEKSFNRNGKVEKLRITYEGGYVEVRLNDLTWDKVKNNEYTDSVSFTEPLYTDYIRIEIVSASKGTEFDDTCISKIGLTALGNKSDRKINIGYIN